MKFYCLHTKQDHKMRRKKKNKSTTTFPNSPRQRRDNATVACRGRWCSRSNPALVLLGQVLVHWLIFKWTSAVCAERELTVGSSVEPVSRNWWLFGRKRLKRILSPTSCNSTAPRMHFKRAPKKPDSLSQTGWCVYGRFQTEVLNRKSFWTNMSQLNKDETFWSRDTNRRFIFKHVWVESRL